MKRRQPDLILDEPDSESPAYEMLKHLDDAQVIALAKAGDPDAKLDLERRARMEVCWSGEWSADAAVAVSSTEPPIPAHWNRPRKKETLSGKLQNRAEVRKLYAQARSGPKAQRDVAKYLLKTRYGQSVS